MARRLVLCFARVAYNIYYTLATVWMTDLEIDCIMGGKPL